jgi:hypothetical protein
MKCLDSSAQIASKFFCLMIWAMRNPLNINPLNIERRDDPKRPLWNRINEQRVEPARLSLAFVYGTPQLHSSWHTNILILDAIIPTHILHQHLVLKIANAFSNPRYSFGNWPHNLRGISTNGRPQGLPLSRTTFSCGLLTWSRGSWSFALGALQELVRIS